MPNLISTLLSITIWSSILVGGVQTFSKYHGILEARAVMRKLDYTISLAKSIALTSQEDIKVCPNQDKAWHQGWNIQTKDRKVLKKIKNNTSSVLHFDVYPKGSICIDILKTGTSSNDGHFTYRSLSLLYTVQRKLFFNQGLRTYCDDQ